MTTLLPPPGQPVVRLSTPPEIVRAIPSLLGFHPTASLVVLGLAGPRRRLQMTLRIDLPAPGSETAVADQVAVRLGAEPLSACVVVLFTTAASGGAAKGALPARGRAALPGATVAFAVDDALREVGLDVRELLRVENGRWWSYGCERPCCPPDGLPVGSGPTTLLEVLRVAAGRPVFADRSELVASAARRPGEPTDALRAAIRAREDEVAGEPPGPLAARELSELQALLLSDAARATAAETAAARATAAETAAVRATAAETAVARSTAAETASPGTAEPTAIAADAAGLSSGAASGGVGEHDDWAVAHVAVALTHLAVRDASFAWTGGPLAGAAAGLWAELVRRVPPPYAAAPATLLAVGAYRRGDGALADAYLRRALDDDPDYRMADLVLTSLENGFRPTEVESALGLGGVRRAAHRGARSARGGGRPSRGPAPSHDGGTDAR